MRPYYRLAAPAGAFAGIGALLLVLTPLPNFTLEGGLATSGGYALALQVVLAMFLLAAIDELRQPIGADARAGAGEAVDSRAVDATASIWSALRDFYLRHPLPASLLGFGLSASLAALLIGMFGEWGWISPAEIGLAVLLVISSAVQVRVLHWGFFGWTTGFTLGSGLALLEFERGVYRGPQPVVWLALVAGLWALGGIVYGVRASRSRRGASPASGTEPARGRPANQ